MESEIHAVKALWKCVTHPSIVNKNEKAREAFQVFVAVEHLVDVPTGSTNKATGFVLVM
jgi:hypothetical protein